MILLYQKVKNYLIEKIESSNPGDKLPSENELCQQFNVSRITVQRAIKDLLEEKLILRKKGKGTFVVPSIIKHTSTAKTIKIIFPAGGDPEDDFLFPIIRCLLDQFGSNGFEFSLMPWEQGKQKIDFSGCSGVFWIAPNKKDFNKIEEISLKGIPLIVINRVMENFVNFVSTDHYKAGLMGAEYLISKGHTNIGFVGLIKDNTCSSQMYRGYCNVIENSHVKISSHFTVSAFINSKLEINQSFHKQLSEMLERYKPTGLFVAGELFLSSVLKIVEKKNLVPGRDIDIVLSDEVPEGTPYKENIACIIQPLREIGDIAARAMKQIINGEKKTIRVKLSPIKGRNMSSIHFSNELERR
ncbi:MAG: GntR family transcriptional regulator [bacterium]|nr:GntR family transcriptional regulator [bacterium]